MTLLTALILGAIQGLTEFFPISSSAHLEIFCQFFGISEPPIIFFLACHLGTLCALIWFFKNEVVHLIRHDRAKLAYLFLALLPLIPCYFLLAPLREIASTPKYLGLFLMVTGGILLAGQKIRIKAKSSLLRDVLLIGVMQSVALIPGISRSASTISCAQVLGWSKREAVRFSFLLAIPTIIGGNLLEIQKLFSQGRIVQLMQTNSMIGFVAAFGVGMFVIRFAIRWLEKGNLQLFAWYCLGLGATLSLYFALR